MKTYSFEHGFIAIRGSEEDHPWVADKLYSLRLLQHMVAVETDGRPHLYRLREGSGTGLRKGLGKYMAQDSQQLKGLVEGTSTTVALDFTNRSGFAGGGPRDGQPTHFVESRAGAQRSEVTGGGRQRPVFEVLQQGRSAYRFVASHPENHTPKRSGGQQRRKPSESFR